MDITDVLENQSFVHVGVDLAKNVFQVAYMEPRTNTLVNQQMNRTKFEKFLKDSKIKFKVVMEACSTCHYWGRECRKYGHLPMIIPAEITNSINIGSKDDKNDAHAIWQASFLPAIKTINVRSEENQAEGYLLKTRDFVLKIDTETNNNLKALLSEYGCVCNTTGYEKTKAVAQAFLDKAFQENKPWASTLKESVDALNKVREAIQESEKKLHEKIVETAKNNDLAQRLMTIPYVGPITSLALANVMADPALFKNGRQFADYCGETPYHTGSGGKIIMMGVNRKGNSVLKRSLYEGASNLYNRVKKGIESKSNHYYQSDWILNLVRSKPRKVAICAIANKMCRIAWAVAATENGRYDRTKTSLVSVLMKSPEQIEQQKAAKAQAKAQAAAKAA